MQKFTDFKILRQKPVWEDHKYFGDDAISNLKKYKNMKNSTWQLVHIKTKNV